MQLDNELPNLEMLKVALHLNESDDESIVSSNAGSDSGEERDLVKALAQRATDPFIKARKAKGPFVYVKPRLRPGRHIYINEEISKTKDAYLEEQLRQKLKGAQFRVTGLVKFDQHGNAKDFEVEGVAAAISSAVRAVLQEERAAAGTPLGAAQQELLDADFASKVAERAVRADPVFEEAVRAVRVRAMDSQGRPATSPAAQPYPASSPPPASPWAQVLMPGNAPPGSPSALMHAGFPTQGPPPTSSHGHPLMPYQPQPPEAWYPHAPQVLSLDAPPPSPSATLPGAPSLSTLPHSSAATPGQAQQVHPGTMHPHTGSLLPYQQDTAAQHAPGAAQSQQEPGWPPGLHLQVQGGTKQGQSYQERGQYYQEQGAARDDRGGHEGSAHTSSHGRHGPREPQLDGYKHRSNRLEGETEPQRSRPEGHGGREHSRHHRSGARDGYGGEGRHSMAEGDGRQRPLHIREQGDRDATEERGDRYEHARSRHDHGRQNLSRHDYGKHDHGRHDYNRYDHSRRDYSKHEHSSRDYSKHKHSRLNVSGNDHHSHYKGGEAQQHRRSSHPVKDDRRFRGASGGREKRQFSSRAPTGKKGSNQRHPETVEPMESMRTPPPTRGKVQERQTKKQPLSDTDSQGSQDSKFEGLEALLASEEAAAFLRPAVSPVSSEAEPSSEVPRRSQAEVKAMLHCNPKARQMKEARKEHWTSSEDEGLGAYLREKS